MKYVLGNGKTAISAGELTELEIPFIKLELIENKSFKVGEDISNTEIETHSSTSIIFKNLEGLAVLEKAIKYAKKQLKQQNKKL